MAWKNRRVFHLWYKREKVDSQQKNEAQCEGAIVQKQILAKKVTPDVLNHKGYKKNVKNLMLPHITDIPLRELIAVTIQDMISKLFEKSWLLNRLSAVKGNLTGSLDYLTLCSKS